MKIHWLIKYYLVGFTAIFSFAYYIEKSEPYLNYKLYPEISEIKLTKFIQNKNCDELTKLYKNEIDENYVSNYLGFLVRKDKKKTRGLNLLKYLNFHLEQSNCKKFN